MIERRRHLNAVEGLLQRHPVVAIVGARQVGKSTLARWIFERWTGPKKFFDLEDPGDLVQLEDPMLALRNLEGLVVLDEIQRVPELFSVIRVLADRPQRPARFLILGSASPSLLQQSSESLAGRIAYYRLDGLALDEAGGESLEKLWLRGGFPRSFKAEDNRASSEWRREFIRTFLERDIKELGIAIPSVTLRRFWTMLAHYHGQVWNASEFARSFGVADTTVRRYLDILTATFLVRQVQPWHANVGKRQVKSPKVFLTDTGILHQLLGLVEQEDLEGHPKVGASWEGFAIEVICTCLGVQEEERFFWATHAGAEIDLVVMRGNHRWGFEVKRTTTPRVTRSMRIAQRDLDLESVNLIHAGTETFEMADGIRAIALGRAIDDLVPV